MSNIHAIWLSTCTAVGSVRAKLFIDFFGSFEDVYKASRRDLIRIKGIGEETVKDLVNKDLSKAEQIMSACEKTGCSVITIKDKEYPDRLRNIYDPPTVLYVKGKMPRAGELPVIGVVGTRNCTPYGYKHAERLGRNLSRHGIIVSTGLARGIDTAAARGALLGDAPIIGVVGCGADMIYPPQNRQLFENVAKHGAIVSEYPPGTEARPEYFPARNRIISGFANGVAVIEAPQKSGALITAERAMEQGRDVFVLPGNVDSSACMGSNKLLRLGAIPFMTADDIIDEYRDFYPEIQKSIDNKSAVDYIDVDKLAERLGANEKAIVKTIGRGSMHIDEIIAATGLAAQTALASLTTLELDGCVRHENTGKWEIAK